MKLPLLDKIIAAAMRSVPARHRTESPVAYYKRTKCVDARYLYKHNGWYYCNPAHCKHRWRNKAERDEHLEKAYRILD